MRAAPADLSKIVWRRVSRFQQPEESLGYLLWHVTHGWIRFLNNVLSELGLTHLQFLLIGSTAWLSRTGSVSQARLADFFKMDPMLVSKTLRTLERNGIVMRRADPSDSRAKQVLLTEEGLELFLRGAPLIDRAYDKFFAPFGNSTKSVHAALLKLYRTIDK
ncbi:MAG: MarR family winged helix-turn-helix transcriptional regulator [Candidatus Binataceae bacterium]